MDTHNVVEIKSALWQRIFVAAVFGFMCACSIPLLVSAFEPHAVRVAAKGFESGIVSFVCGNGLAACCFWAWRRTERYRVKADGRGIEQRTGFHTTRVDWQDVAYHRMKRLRWTRERFIEPVLYDHDDRVSLRPVSP